VLVLCLATKLQVYNGESKAEHVTNNTRDLLPSNCCLRFKVDLPFGVIRSVIHFNNTTIDMVSQNKSKKRPKNGTKNVHYTQGWLASFLPALLSAY
jgi:hypothetical protein